MTAHPLRPVTHRSLGRPLPHQQANKTQAHPQVPEGFKPLYMHRKVHMRYCTQFPELIPRLRVDYLRVTHPSATLLSQPKSTVGVRLACVKRAASVRPEPGSNSPLYLFIIFIRIDIRHQHIPFVRVCQRTPHQRIP